jgi:hypothetical protein
MSQTEDPPFSLDVTGLWLIIAMVFMIGPATLLASVWVLTHGLDFAATTTFELIVTVLVGLLTLVLLRAGVGELRGALGIRIDDAGVHRRGQTIAWADVERIEEPTYGSLEIVGAGKSVVLRTYLFREPKRLIDHIVTKTGTAITKH